MAGSGLSPVVTGNDCLKGQDFAEDWVDNSERTLTTTVRTKFPDIPVISVRTEQPIARNAIPDAMHEINAKIVETELGCGDTLIEDVAGTGVRVIVTSFALMQLGAELENKNEQLNRAASGGASAATGGGIGTVRKESTIKVLDDIGEDAVGGFVGAAGEAVGVEDAEVDEQDKNDDGKKSKEIYVRKGRAQLNRR